MARAQLTSSLVILVEIDIILFNFIFFGDGGWSSYISRAFFDVQPSLQDVNYL